MTPPLLLLIFLLPPVVALIIGDTLTSVFLGMLAASDMLGTTPMFRGHHKAGQQRARSAVSFAFLFMPYAYFRGRRQFIFLLAVLPALDA